VGFDVGDFGFGEANFGGEGEGLIYCSWIKKMRVKRGIPLPSVFQLMRESESWEREERESASSEYEFGFEFLIRLWSLSHCLQMGSFQAW